MAERGKWAEAEVRKVLSDMEREVAGFCFNRIPDAHGGYMQPADADFQWFLDTGYGVVSVAPNTGPGTETPVPFWEDAPVYPAYTRNGVIEVKEVEHLTLLPHKNFSADKIARVVRRSMAGCDAIILVAHKLKGMRKPDVTWRLVPLMFFQHTAYVKGVASWDLSSFPLVNMEQTLRHLLLKERRK